MLQVLIRRNIYLKTMYNYSTDLIISSLPFSPNYIFRNFTQEKRIRLEPNTFQPRILKYFQKNNEALIKNKNLNHITFQHYKPDNLKNVDNQELHNLIYILLEQKLKDMHFKYYLQYLDKECCIRLPGFTFNEIFNYLNTFMLFLPNIITKLQFYNKSMEMISFSIDRCSQSELLKLCFYVGLQKKSKESQKLLKKCLIIISSKYLNNLNANDMAILCNSCYKTSTRIKYKNVLKKIIEILNNNLIILNDPAIFVQLVKSLRHNQYQNEEILTTISHTIMFNKSIKYYNFTACSHILALYADVLFYDNNLFKLLTNKCITYLQNATLPKSKKEHFSKQLRIKDIARFLWSLSYISYDDLSESVITNYIEPFLNTYITLKQFDKDVENVIDILLSMYILNYNPSDHLLSSVITKNTAFLIYAKRKQAFATRLHLLQTIIKWKQPELFNKLHITYITPTNSNIDSQLKSRPLLRTLCNSLNIVTPYFDINKIEYTFTVPYLHIMGLTGLNKENKASLYVELVDHTLLVQNKNETPNGFMNLKINLLRKLGKTVLVIFGNEIADKNQPELHKYLEKKLKRIYVP